MSNYELDFVTWKNNWGIHFSNLHAQLIFFLFSVSSQDILQLVDTPLLMVDTPLPQQDIPLQQGILLVTLQLLVAIPLLKGTRQLAVTPLLLGEATHLVQVGGNDNIINMRS